MNNIAPPLFILRTMESSDSGIYYSISVKGAEQSEPRQRVFFDRGDYSITFMEPYAPFYLYLLENEKWLRSILYTTLKNINREKSAIPFSFPEEKPLSPPSENAVRVYCDGSCSDKGDGGWGGVIIFPGNEPLEVSGEEKNTTSNRMELAAAVESLRKAEEMMEGEIRPVVLLSDSHYVIHGITHRLQVWMRNGFVTALGSSVLNRDLWEELASVMERVEVCCVKVYAAEKDQFHIRCDKLAGFRMRGGSL